MLTRNGGHLFPRETPAPAASARLEQEGWMLLEAHAGDAALPVSDV